MMYYLQFLFLATFFATRVTGSCSNGEAEVNCFAQPCAVTQCNETYVTCEDNYCGGCNAIFTNAAGDQVCNGTSSAGQQETSGCTSDDECGESEFCSAWECRAFGSCATLLDCLNPANAFLKVQCVGQTYCSENGECGVSCTDSLCPNGDQVYCYVQPCAVTQCDEPYVTCLDNYCGGCNAIFIDAAGNQVCDGSSGGEQQEDSASACSSDGDCDESTEFCSAGECRPYASCGSLLDCLNPDNIFKVPTDCAGYMSCDEEDGCDLVCSNRSCPHHDEVNCLAQPCSVTTCDEPYEHCVDYYCGGCRALFINAAGEEVCEGALFSPKCVNYETVETDLLAARALWADPACYDFTVQRLGMMPEDETRPFNMTVRNRTVVENGGGSTNETINSLLYMIEKHCIAGCSEGSSGAAHKCEIEYAPDGFPISIFIDYEEMIADEEYSLLVSNLAVIEDCGPTTIEAANSDTSSSISLLHSAVIVVPLILAYFH
jgi:hypothetical protein